MSPVAINFLETAVSRRVPRFLYHITSKCNYESMLNEGQIKMSAEAVDGVFTIDLKNFFKRWGRDASWNGDSLQEGLIKCASNNGTDEIVILRIPTANLNADKLAIRGQKTCFSWFEKHGDAVDEIYETAETAQQGKDKFLSYLKTHESNKEIIDMIEGNIPANKYKHYTRRKEALEFVYKDNIPIESAEKIGEVDVAQLEQSAEYDPTKPMHSIFTALLKDTPECQGAKLLNC